MNTSERILHITLTTPPDDVTLDLVNDTLFEDGDPVPGLIMARTPLELDYRGNTPGAKQKTPYIATVRVTLDPVDARPTFEVTRNGVPVGPDHPFRPESFRGFLKDLLRFASKSMLDG